MGNLMNLSRIIALAQARKEYFHACQGYADTLIEIWKRGVCKKGFIENLSLRFEERFNAYLLLYKKDDVEYNALLTMEELIFLANNDSANGLDVEYWLTSTDKVSSFTDYWKEWTKRRDGKPEDIGDYFI